MDTELHEEIALHVDRASSRMVKWIAGLIFVVIGTIFGAVFWAGSMHALVSDIRTDLSWLVREKIPQMDAETRTIELQLQRGILPQAERRIEQLDSKVDELEREIIRRAPK